MSALIPGGPPAVRLTLGGFLAKLVILIALLVGLVAAFVTRSLPWQAPYQGPVAADFPRGTLLVNFGIQRLPQTRSILISTGGTSPAGAETVTPRLSADLIASPKLEQFPADQVTLTATPVGAGQVEVTASLNPTSPERAGDGLFTGTISVLVGSRSVSVPIAVYLAPKSGYRALLAFLLLLLGAIFGLSVKWVTEALSSLAAARWRFDAITQRLRGSGGLLPTSAEDLISDIWNRISRQDVSQLDGSFESLESALGPLRTFSESMKNVNDDIRLQRKARHDQSLPVDDVISEERRQVADLLNRDWPWPDTSAVLAEAKQLSAYARAATGAITAGRPDVVSLFAKGDFAAAFELYRSPSQQAAAQGSDDSAAESARLRASDDGQVPHIQDLEMPPMVLLQRRWIGLFNARGWIQWMTERPRTLAAVASILVVSIVGLQLQYLDSTSFDGSLASWLSLLLWAAVIELSGVSVLDVVGRLSGGASTPRPSPR